MVLTVSLVLLVFVWTGLAEKFVVPSCDRYMFDSNVDDCLSDFNRSLETSGYQDSCPWPAVKRVYNKLKYCVDGWAKASWCSGRGFFVDEIFLKVHETYFSLCGQVIDPPLTTVIMLIAPVVMATLFLPLVCNSLTTYNIEMPGSLGL